MGLNKWFILIKGYSKSPYTNLCIPFHCVPVFRHESGKPICSFYVSTKFGRNGLWWLFALETQLKTDMNWGKTKWSNLVSQNGSVKNSTRSGNKTQTTLVCYILYLSYQCPVSSVQFTVSGVRYPVSSVQCTVSSIYNVYTAAHLAHAQPWKSSEAFTEPPL